MKFFIGNTSHDYRRFLAVRQLPRYRFVGGAVEVPDEYAAALGLAPPETVAADASFVPSPFLFDYQRSIAALAVRKRKFAVFADCGLGKTLILAEFVRHTVACGARTLVVSPLMVVQQTADEIRRFYGDSLPVEIVESGRCQAWCDGTGAAIGLTNYEAFRQDIKPGNVRAIVLDESSMLKSHYGRYGTAIIETARGLPWKLALTGTPAPNDRIEYANHAVLLDAARTVNEFLARYFVNRGETSNRWELKPHALRGFYRELSHWCLFLSNPAVYGWQDNTGDVPPIEVVMHHVEETDAQRSAIQSATGRLIAGTAGGIGDRGTVARIAKGSFNGERIATRKPGFIRDLVRSWPEAATLVWCKYDDEQRQIEEVLPDAASIGGWTPHVDRMRMIDDFKAGRVRTLISKPKILGFGLNLQVCTRMVFSTMQDCYSDDTEILTPTGWRLFGSLATGDDVATVNPQSMAFEWQPCSRVVNSPYVGEMLRFHGRGFDLLVTPNHRMWCRRDATRYPASSGQWEVRTADELRQQYRRQGVEFARCPTGWSGRSPEDVLIPRVGRAANATHLAPIAIGDYAALAGWYLSEGYVTRHRGRLTGRIVICQTDANPEYRREIIDLLRRIGLTPKHKTKDITVSCFDLASHLSERFGEGSYHKRIPEEVRNWKTPELRVLLDAMLKGDGHKIGDTHDSLRSFSSGLLSDAQEVCLKLGIASSINTKHGNLNLAWQHTTPSLLSPPESVPYSGRIVCCRTDNGLLIVRRHGKALVCGNSYEEYYQAVKRANRIGSTTALQVHVPMTDSEEPMVRNVLRKAANVAADTAEQETLFREVCLAAR